MWWLWWLWLWLMGGWGFGVVVVVGVGGMGGCGEANGADCNPHITIGGHPLRGQLLRVARAQGQAAAAGGCVPAYHVYPKQTEPSTHIYLTHPPIHPPPTYIATARDDNKRQKALERELEWMRMSPKARQTKSKARISSYEQMVQADEEARDNARSMINNIYIPPGGCMYVYACICTQRSTWGRALTDGTTPTPTHPKPHTHAHAYTMQHTTRPAPGHQGGGGGQPGQVVRGPAALGQGLLLPPARRRGGRDRRQRCADVDRWVLPNLVWVAFSRQSIPPADPMTTSVTHLQAWARVRCSSS